MGEDNGCLGGGPGAFKEKNPSAEEFFMKSKQHGLVTKKSKCPECGNMVTWREESGLKRFQRKAKKCDSCGTAWR